MGALDIRRHIATTETLSKKAVGTPSAGVRAHYFRKRSTRCALPDSIGGLNGIPVDMAMVSALTWYAATTLMENIYGADTSGVMVRR